MSVDGTVVDTWDVLPVEPGRLGDDVVAMWRGYAPVSGDASGGYITSKVRMLPTDIRLARYWTVRSMWFEQDPYTGVEHFFLEFSHTWPGAKADYLRASIERVNSYYAANIAHGLATDLHEAALLHGQLPSDPTAQFDWVSWNVNPGAGGVHRFNITLLQHGRAL